MGRIWPGMDNSLMKDDPDRLACLPLAQLDRLLYRNAIQQQNLKVYFNHEALDLGQDAENAWVDVETPEGQQRLKAEYIGGCDAPIASSGEGCTAIGSSPVTPRTNRSWRPT